MLCWQKGGIVFIPPHCRTLVQNSEFVQLRDDLDISAWVKANTPLAKLISNGQRGLKDFTVAG
jgi:hypothetical protein